MKNILLVLALLSVAIFTVGCCDPFYSEDCPGGVCPTDNGGFNQLPPDACPPNGTCDPNLCPDGVCPPGGCPNGMCPR
jgi:hypothetical protein